MANKYEVVKDIDSQIEHIPSGGVIERRLLANKKVKVTLLGLAPEQKLADPAPGGPAVIQVQRGRGVVVVGDESHDVQPGSWITLNKPTPHRLESHSEMVVLVTEFEK